VAGGDLSESISVRARFERFPTTVKGAFILRGEDPNPHQVELRGGNVVGVGMSTRIAMPLAGASLDVIPHRDVFVPFEVPLGDLGPGWYTLEAVLEVDGIEGAFDGGRRFSVPWPRATVWRGQVKVDRDVEVGPSRVRVEQLDCGGDAVKIHLRVDPAAPIAVAVSADGEPIEMLDLEQDEASGRTKVTTYPVMRTHASVNLDLGIGSASASLEIPLPR
jgi:hypothetical protein